MQSFMDSNAAALGDVSHSVSRATLTTTLLRLEAVASAQITAEVRATMASQREHELRNHLRVNQMQPVAALARAKLAHTPDIANLRVRPINTPDSLLVAAALTMAEEASRFSSVFAGEHLPDRKSTRLNSSHRH